jgi:insulysin
MSEAEFKKYQESLKKSYLEEVKNLSQEFNRIWSHIQSSHYNFEQNELDAAKVEEITLQEAINFYEMKIHPSATLRRKVSSTTKISDEIHTITQELSALFDFHNACLKTCNN